MSIQSALLKHSTREKCLCGKQATEIRWEEDEYGNQHSEEYFCQKCADESDAMTPADVM